MQILNFTEQQIKPSLQDKSKCFTIRKAWDWKLERRESKAGYAKFVYSTIEWIEQEECRHKVGALEQTMWNQRGKNGLCGNCVRFDSLNRCVNDAYARFDPEKYALILKPETKCLDISSAEGFSKVFGVGKIVETPKVWMEYDEKDGLLIHDLNCNPLEIITGKGIFFKRDTPSISQQDGFKNPVDFKNFFLKHYPILRSEQMPFWRIGWEWQK